MQSVGRRICAGAAAATVLIHSGCSLAALYPPLDVADNVDIASYTGLWYEIARYPTRFQEGCYAVTAEYTLRDDGRVRVVNACHEDSVDGPIRTIEGFAEVADDETNARLTVYFFYPFGAPYWILELDEDYRWAVIGEPSRTYLWILSRTPTLDAQTYEAILTRLPEKGYDPARLMLTPQ